MNISRLKIGISVLVILLIFSGSIKLRASSELGLQESDIETTTIPENPQPYEDITIKLTSYATDLNKALIEWRSGSRTVLSGYGTTSYSFKTAGPNTITIVDITISIPGTTDTVTKRVTINPSEVELVWEGVDSYTPPFYRGKALVSQEGKIKVVAIPNTNTIKQGKGSVTYSWKSGGNTVQGSSGYNKDSFVFTNSELNDSENVTVTAESINGTYSATNSISIPITDPQVIFYKKSPTEGVLYNQALTNNTFIPEDEVTVNAEPYYLGLKGRESLFTYNWTINGKTIDTPAQKTQLTIRPASRGGYATIGLTLENLNSLYQKAVGKLKLGL